MKDLAQTVAPEASETGASRAPLQWRKRPVVIEAFQMTKERRASNEHWPNWMHEAWNKDFREIGMLGCEDFPTSDGTDRLIIRTLEGVVTVNWGDWIIQGVAGELYPCKPDIFAATYEPVAGSSAPTPDAS